MSWRIEIKEKKGIFDAVGEGVKKDILDLGIKGVREVRFAQVYTVQGDLREDEVERICEELLVDKISQEYSVRTQERKNARTQGQFIVEVAHNPGVMDPAEGSALKAVKDLGMAGATSIKTAKKYLIKGKLTDSQLKTISEKLLYNKLIQHIVKLQVASDKSQVREAGYRFNLINVDLLNANDLKLKKISRNGQLFLNLAEMRRIKEYFKKLERNPTDCELETIAQTWSEHCWHKTFRGKIDYTEVTRTQGHKATRTQGHKVTRKIDNLLKSTIMKATKELDKPWCVSVFEDNSGVIRFDDKYNICFKVETHNHPSALEPFGGANTGIGGVIRDPLGTGLGAKPIANTDVFCFAPPDYPFNRLPAGSLHPKRSRHIPPPPRKVRPV